MSLIYCPECGHEVSAIAPTCPNCGHPFRPTPPVPRVVVTDLPPEREGFPPWVFIPLGILGVGVIFLLFFAFRGNQDEANERVNINVAARRQPNTVRDTGTTDSQTVTVPPSSTDSQTVNVPGSQTTVTAPPDKGVAIVDAKIATRSGTAQPVKNEKFYLLDEDLESILSDAGLDPVEGQSSLLTSFGLSVMNPGRYGDFNRGAMDAIRRHIKYSTTTDGSGKGQVQNIEPDSYYLFGVTKTREGFAIWSSPVSIAAGQNNLNLSPQRITEVVE